MKNLPRETSATIALTLLGLIALIVFLLLSGCGGPPPKVGDDCGCDNRGINTYDANGDQLVCMRIVQQFPDGGVDYPDCRGGICCAWGKP